MKHFLGDLYYVCSNYSPGIQIGPALGIMGFPYIVNASKISFLKTSRAIAFDI
jgi:hypothetical protein